MKKSFKTIVAAICAITVLSMISCNKTEKQIIGTWNVQKVIATTTISGLGAGIDGTTRDTAYFKDGEATMTFKDDNTMTIIGINEDTGETEVETATYAIDDDKLTITADNEVTDYTIVDIDKKNMQLNGSLEQSHGEASLKSEVDIYMKKK